MKNKKLILIFLFVFGQINASIFSQPERVLTKFWVYDVAIHEAAHAVAANKLGLKVYDISIIESHENGYDCAGYVLSSWLNIKNEIKVLVAGYLAEELFLNKKYSFLNENKINNEAKKYIRLCKNTFKVNNEYSAHDFGKTLNYIILDNILQKEVEQNLDLALPKIKQELIKYKKETRELILENQEVIKKLAERLLYEKEMNEAELSAFFNSIKSS